MRAQTAMASALSRAGYDIAEARLRQLVQDAMAKHHGNVDRAKSTLRKSIVADPLEDDIFDILCAEHLTHHEFPGAGQFAHETLEELARDGKPNGGAIARNAFETPKTDAGASPTYLPGRSKRGLKSLQGLADNSMRRGLLFMHKCSDGRYWGDVGYHELDGMDRDGVMARLIKRRCGIPSNRQASLHTLFKGDGQFQEILDDARRLNDVS